MTLSDKCHTMPLHFLAPIINVFDHQSISIVLFKNNFISINTKHNIKHNKPAYCNKIIFNYFIQNITKAPDDLMFEAMIVI